jgi:hypothetical protein
MSRQAGRFSGVKLLIILVPAWLLLSGAVAVWLHFRAEKNQIVKIEHAYQKSVNAKSIADDFSKIVDVIGPRHLASPAAIEGLKRVASMIEGALGASNMGYEVRKFPCVDGASDASPLIAVDVMRRKTVEKIWVLCSYDSPLDIAHGADSASSIAVTLAVAQAMVGRELTRNVHFLFLPMGNADAQSRMAMLAKAHRLITKDANATQVLVVGSMLHPGDIQVISRDANQPVVSRADDLFAVAENAEICMQDDAEVSSQLHEMGLPAALLLTIGNKDEEAGSDLNNPSVWQLQQRAVSILQVIERLVENK